MNPFRSPMFRAFLVLLLLVETSLGFLLSGPLYLPSRMVLKVRTLPSSFQVFYASPHKPFNEPDSTILWVDSPRGHTEVVFPLPGGEIDGIRIDPGMDPAPSSISISEIRIESLLKTRRLTPAEVVESFEPNKYITSFEVRDGTVMTETLGGDPSLVYRGDFSPLQTRIRRRDVHALAAVALVFLFALVWVAHRYRALRAFVVLLLLVETILVFVLSGPLYLPSRMVLKVRTLPSSFQVFYASPHKPFNQPDSTILWVDSPRGHTEVVFPLPGGEIDGIRIDPGMDPAPGSISISEIRIESLLKTRRLTPAEVVESFEPNDFIKPLEVRDGTVMTETLGGDPSLVYRGDFSPLQTRIRRRDVHALAAVALVFLFALVWAARRFGMDGVRRIARSGFGLPLLLVLLSAISATVYYQFLAARKFFVFTDIGGDTLVNYWPYLRHAADLMAAGDLFSFWSFAIGLGSSTFSMMRTVFDPFHLPLLLAGRERLIYLLPYAMVAKVLCAGVFGWFFLRSARLSRYASFAGALMFALNGYLILWGQHYAFGTFAVFLPLILWGVERVLRQRDWLLFTLSVAIAASTKYYFLYMLCVFLVVYVPYRYLLVRRFSPRDALGTLGMLAGSFALGIGLSAAMFLPSAAAVFGSSRIENSSSIPLLERLRLLDLDNPLYYVTTVLRFFSNEAAGVGSYYHGFGNYYDGVPVLYAGLIVLLLVPQALRVGGGRERALHALFLAALGLMLALPFVSISMNFFTYPTYRWSFVIIASLILLAATALSAVEDGRTLSGRLLVFTIIALGAFCLAAAFGGARLGWSPEQFQSVLQRLGIYFGLLGAYAVLLYLLGRPERRRLAGALIAILLCAELGAAAWITNNKRFVLPVSSEHYRNYEFDYTAEAVSFIREKDAGFFRIEKGYVSRWYADPLFQGYLGVTAYESVNQASYMDFLRGVDLSPSTPTIVADYGSRTALQTLVGVKYYLTLREDAAPYGYEPIGRRDDVFVYRNAHWLPLGFAYDAYIPLVDFQGLSSGQKDAAVLKGFVWAGPEEGVAGLRTLSTDDLREGVRKPVSLAAGRIELTGAEVIGGALPDSARIRLLSGDSVITIPFERGIRHWRESEATFIMNGPVKGTSWPVKCTGWIGLIEGDGLRDARSRFEVRRGRHAYSLSLVPGDSDGIRIQLNSRPGDYSVEGFEIWQGNPSETYEADVLRLRGEPFEVTSFHQGEIEGSISLSSRKMVFWSIPYDRGWHLFVDGSQVPLERINIGFIGARLGPGKHDVRLLYAAPLLREGQWTSLASALLLLALLYRRRRAQTSGSKPQ